RKERPERLTSLEKPLATCERLFHIQRQETWNGEALEVRERPSRGGDDPREGDRGRLAGEPPEARRGGVRRRGDGRAGPPAPGALPEHAPGHAAESAQAGAAAHEGRA